MTCNYCEECFDYICSKDPFAAELWISICKYGYRRGNIIEVKLNNSIEKHLKLLEEDGFILTRDTLDCVQLRVNGMYKFLGEYFYCADSYSHRSHVSM